MSYMDMSTQAGGDMRYPQDTGSSLAIEAAPQQQPSLINLFHPPVLPSSAPYPQDGATFYQPQASSQLFSGLDVRSRLGSNSTSSAGMAHPHPHTHRNTALPHPGSQISAREQYTPATPSFRRPSEHPSRSPSFPATGARRHPLSPTPSPITTFPTAAATTTNNSMGSMQFSNRPIQTTIPPLLPLQMLGSLVYSDGAGTPAKVEINGTIDKGFFLSDNEWTCYRRNYFSCVCSFSLSPHIPGMTIQFTPTGSNQSVQVFGFAMSISAVVSDNEQHSIDLVQHTPKRDKGPVMKPDKVRLGVKAQQASAHHHMGMFQDGAPPSRSLYTDNYSGQSSGPPHPTEHTFERIQFKQATQNNGKRRAAQQYYQLVVELWGDVGSQNSSSEPFVKIATRKSAKMIVRGRSPGHYQNDRRGSQSSGPGGSSGTIGGYGAVGAMAEFGANPMMGPQGYASGFDGRAVYGVRHHDIPPEVMLPAEESRAIATAKEYQYYPSTLYEGAPDRMELFGQQSDRDAAVPHMATGMDINSKVKPEYDGATLPSIFHQAPLGRSSGTFEGKPSTNGYYPTGMMSQSGVNITMT